MSFDAFLLALLIVSRTRARGEDCDNRDAPDYTRLVCVVIITPENGCLSAEDEQPGSRHVDSNSYSECVVSEGVELSVTCCYDDLVLFRDGQSLGNHTASWIFATSLESGTYECRWRNNGTSIANRSVEVNGTVHVIPGAGSHDANPLLIQECERKIVGDFNCSVAESYKRIYPVTDGYTAHDIHFYVLGARPISLSLDVIWVDHYPVEPNLTNSSLTALQDTILHSVHVEFHNLAFVGSMSTQAYLVVTGTTSNHSSTMCVSITLRGEAVLLPNESIPADLTVVEGQQADFYCDAHTTQPTIPVFTVAFLIKLPSSTLAQCLNYTFSQSQPLIRNPLMNHKSCSGLTFQDSYSGHSQDRTYHLTVTWSSVNLTTSGAEVVCAQASSGITQWAQTATLTVISPHPTSTILPFSPTVGMPMGSSSRLKLSSLAVLSVPLVGGVVLLAVLLRWRHKRQVSVAKTCPLQMPLTSPSLPSSACTTPIHSNSQFFPSFTIDYDQLLQKVDELHSYPSTYEVCVYVSYSNSQADWVQDTLLPLLHSFQPIRVTDHEGHMIPGGVVSEERLRLLQSADKVVAVIAPDYQMTEWCNYELQHVLQQSSTRGAGLIIPILCGGCRELPSTISTLHPLSLDDPQWTHKLRIAIRRQHQ